MSDWAEVSVVGILVAGLVGLVLIFARCEVASEPTMQCAEACGAGNVKRSTRRLEGNLLIPECECADARAVKP